MGLMFNRDSPPKKKRDWGISSPLDLIPRRVIATPGTPIVTESNALTHSAVWAAIRIRADLLSTLPMDAFYYANIGYGKTQYETNLSPFMASPKFMEWRYSSQVELDRSGNSIGIILERDKANYPAEIELHSSAECSARISGTQITQWMINGTAYDPVNIWHEKQYTVSGFPLGLSPVAYSAMTLGQYKSIQEFAQKWFVSGQGPRASLKNTEKIIDPKNALLTKEAWRASQSMGEPFVHGNDWEYNLIQAEQASNDWLDAMKSSNIDVARFFNVPATVIDAAISGESITYASLDQRSLQLLVYHLGPTIVRRENALSQLLPRPRFVKLNSDALLRMDPKSRAEMIDLQLHNHSLTVTEARALDNRQPYTQEQIDETLMYFPPKGSSVAPATPVSEPDSNQGNN